MTCNYTFKSWAAASVHETQLALVQPNKRNVTQVINLATGRTFEGMELPDGHVHICAVRRGDTVWLVSRPPSDEAAAWQGVQLRKIEGEGSNGASLTVCYDQGGVLRAAQIK